MANSVQKAIAAAQSNVAGSSVQRPGPSNMADNFQKAIAAAQRQGKTIKQRMRTWTASDLLLP